MRLKKTYWSLVIFNILTPKFGNLSKQPVLHFFVHHPNSPKFAFCEYFFLNWSNYQILAFVSYDQLPFDHRIPGSSDVYWMGAKIRLDLDLYQSVEFDLPTFPLRCKYFGRYIRRDLFVWSLEMVQKDYRRLPCMTCSARAVKQSMEETQNGILYQYHVNLNQWIPHPDAEMRIPRSSPAVFQVPRHLFPSCFTEN